MILKKIECQQKIKINKILNYEPKINPNIKIKDPYSKIKNPNNNKNKIKKEEDNKQKYQSKKSNIEIKKSDENNNNISWETKYNTGTFKGRISQTNNLEDEDKLDEMDKTIYDIFNLSHIEKKIPLFSTLDELHKHLIIIFLQNPKLIKDSQKDNDLNIKEVDERINQQLILFIKIITKTKVMKEKIIVITKMNILLDLKIIKLMIPVKKK